MLCLLFFSLEIGLYKNPRSKVEKSCNKLLPFILSLLDGPLPALSLLPVCVLCHVNPSADFPCQTYVRTVSQSSSFPFLRLRHGLIVYSLKQMLPRWISCKCEEIFRRTKNKQTSVNDLFWTGKTEKEEKTKGPVYFCRWCQICATMTFCEECFCRLNDQWKYEMPTPEWHSSHLPVKFTFWRWFWSSLWPSLSLSLSFSLLRLSDFDATAETVFEFIST